MEIFKPYSFDKGLFLTTLALITLGLVMVYSSTGVLAGEKLNQTFYFLIQQAIGAGIGLVFILVMISVKTPFYQNKYFIFGLLTLTFVLLVLCFGMPAVAKTNRWVTLLGFRFQPSELAKISLILFLALYLDMKRDRLDELPVLLVPLGVLFLFVLLILKEPDFGTAVLTFGICSILFYIGGVKLRYFAGLGLASLPLFVFYLFQARYRVDRFLAFLYPDKDPLSLNFQVAQSKIAIGSGGLLGVSLGESAQKLYFLPCAHTDFIFAIIGEELGLVGTLTTVILFVIFLWRGLSIAFKAPNLFSQLAAAGLTFMIVIQALLNITVVLGLGPAKGVPLPLLSYGRSSLITNLFAIGLLLHISQRKGDRRTIK